MIILAIGKLKSPYKELADDFLKRLKVRIIEVKETNKRKETKEVIAFLRKIKGKKILFDVKGKLIDTDFFQRLKNEILVVGGPDGFEREIYNYVDEVVSVSNLTFNHQLFRIILLEQIYRAHASKKGKGYAKH